MMMVGKGVREEFFDMAKTRVPSLGRWITCHRKGQLQEHHNLG